MIHSSPDHQESLIDFALDQRNAVGLILLITLGSAMWGIIVHYMDPPVWLSIIAILCLVTISPLILRIFAGLIHYRSNSSIPQSQIANKHTPSIFDSLNQQQHQLQTIISLTNQYNPLGSEWVKRFSHFHEEKRQIAKQCMPELTYLFAKIEAGEYSKIRLLVDSGSTTLAFVKELKEWVRVHTEIIPYIELVTNNMFVAIELIDVPFHTIIVPGQVDKRYGGIFGHESIAFLEQLNRFNEGERILSIALTAGIYASDDGIKYYVKGQDISYFKKAIMSYAQVVFSLHPLGKMLPYNIEQMNALIPLKENHSSGPDFQEVPLLIDIPDRRLVTVTTSRPSPCLLFPHWIRVEKKLEIQQNMIGKGKFDYLAREFCTHDLSHYNREREFMLEIPSDFEMERIAVATALDIAA